jgi:hypothetical protein
VDVETRVTVSFRVLVHHSCITFAYVSAPMATPIDTASNGDIWHLSIDDLLAPLPETRRLGGPGPFVINLSTSTAPISVSDTRIAGSQHAHVYQIQRSEDRRMRYRLRLGPFTHEDEAITVLDLVRQVYPTALTATADADDLRAIAAVAAKADPVRAPVEKRPVQAQSPQVRAELRRAPEAVSGEPIAPVMSIAQVAPGVPASIAPVAPIVLAPPQAAQSPSVRAASVPRVATVDSTQTVRALTSLELEDTGSLRWYVIQLALSEEAFDPDAVPDLDIFSLYRLYSVAGLDKGRFVHALRLGFFGEEIGATAVAKYLAAYYAEPTIKRVSVAERERFADKGLEARKDVGASGKHAAIEITSERYVRDRQRTGSGVVNAAGAAADLQTLHRKAR